MKTQIELHAYMKTTCCIITCLTALELNSALSQQPPAPMPAPGLQAPLGTSAAADSFSSRLQNIIQKASNPAPEPVLIRFNLDFPGCTPRELVAAIAKATGRPLNAIVKDEFANTKLPALKMTGVTVPELFQAFEPASRGSILGPDGRVSSGSTYGFSTQGKMSDDSIWYFYSYASPPPPSPTAKVCRFYSLANYVDQGLSVDDITTAIETGWKMLGDISPPTISFHKDTKLLIAVGDPSKLETIDAVLKALEPTTVGGGGRGFSRGGLMPPGPRTVARPPDPAAR